jgi:hypothetical protein
VTSREMSLRRAVFWTFAATGEPPPIAGADRETLAELERRHVVVLRDGRIHMAHPFAAHRDGARVDSDDGRTWWGNCAWDGLGIVAALGLSDAVVRSGDAVVHVRGGQVVDDALFQIAVPAARWWDDIEFT